MHSFIAVKLFQVGKLHLSRILGQQITKTGVTVAKTGLAIPFHRKSRNRKLKGWFKIHGHH